MIQRLRRPFFPGVFLLGFLHELLHAQAQAADLGYRAIDLLEQRLIGLNARVDQPGHHIAFRWSKFTGGLTRPASGKQEMISNDKSYQCVVMSRNVSTRLSPDQIVSMMS